MPAAVPAEVRTARRRGRARRRRPRRPGSAPAAARRSASAWRPPRPSSRPAAASANAPEQIDSMPRAARVGGAQRVEHRRRRVRMRVGDAGHDHGVGARRVPRARAGRPRRSRRPRRAAPGARRTARTRTASRRRARAAAARTPRRRRRARTARGPRRSGRRRGGQCRDRIGRVVHDTGAREAPPPRLPRHEPARRPRRPAEASATSRPPRPRDRRRRRRRRPRPRRACVAGIDARSPEAHAAAHLPGARSTSRGRSRRDSLPPATSSCTAGDRAATARRRRRARSPRLGRPVQGDARRLRVLGARGPPGRGRRRGSLEPDHSGLVGLRGAVSCLC